MLPFTLGSSMMSALSGIIVTRTGSYRPVIWGSFAVFTLGMGLMTMLTGTSSTRVIFTRDVVDCERLIFAQCCQGSDSDDYSIGAWRLVPGAV